MKKGTNTYNDLHNAFVSFLTKRFEDELDEVNRIVESAEIIIPNTLHDYFGASYESIYEIQDTNDVAEFCRKIKTHAILKEIDKNEEPRYTEVLNWYRRWLKQYHSNPIPIPTPGEYEIEPAQDSSKVAERSSLPKTLSTVYLEGEAGEAQSAIYRQRNGKLRDACKEYFRLLHNGHLVCECCGFEFAAHYDIDDDYIEIHHRFPFSQTEGEHLVDATTDLVPLCANCHRMIHHGMGGKGNCMSLEELKTKLKKSNI